MTRDSDPEDCLGCRLVSGFGIIGIGVYIFYQAKHRKTLEKYTMNAISAGTFSLGIARLLNMEFLKANKGSR